jgi:pyruvate dehydrogenase (quinone)
VVHVRVRRHEVAIPPSVSAHQASGFTLWATRSVLDGEGAAVIDVVRTNFRQLSLE